MISYILVSEVHGSAHRFWLSLWAVFKSTELQTHIPQIPGYNYNITLHIACLSMTTRISSDLGIKLTPSMSAWPPSMTSATLVVSRRAICCSVTWPASWKKLQVTSKFPVQLNVFYCRYIILWLLVITHLLFVVCVKKMMLTSSTFFWMCDCSALCRKSEGFFRESDSSFQRSGRLLPKSAGFVHT